eukprot:1286614-Pyramimonas_sp.AAC.1
MNCTTVLLYCALALPPCGCHPLWPNAAAAAASLYILYSISHPLSSTTVAPSLPGLGFSHFGRIPNLFLAG